WFCERRRPDLLWARPCRPLQASGQLCRPHPQGREARRPSGAGADQERAGAQSENGQGARLHCAAVRTLPRRRGDRMRRREFITLLASAIATWPLVARTQGVNRPCVGYLFTSEKAEGQGLWAACRQGLRELGYREGENIILEPRWTEGDQEQLPSLVKDLLGLNLAVLVTAATPASLAAKVALNTHPSV